TGPNGNSIFIPASGRFENGRNQEVDRRTYIWSYEQYSYQNAYCLHIHEDGEFISYTPKYVGLSLRGVTADIVDGRYPTLEDDSGIPEMIEPTATDNWIKVTTTGVTIDMENGENSHMYIYNMQGIVAKNISIPLGIRFCTSVDNTTLPPGMYIIKVLSGKHEVTKKFVIR
ncbi:MAG: T9SS type A sorting domain-containing protein, partial [Duncaniella sp.]|nr:T9SS type A sorting domain-containing protein [Duncaniella sp.]